ncbi:PLP-dependent transferase [Epithele typhae]|uniref:PLP-dependent transferase n=1 Tax=Epithele typhae TaxID=378194 RepID=UPI002007543B|nr:PLP-dependent transferase [Epithele typhae]KAH9945382.1 PLP-dependent transferase [Epithele typhae]
MPVIKRTPAPGESYDATAKPPPFGHELKQYFPLEDDYVNLNHGSYGSVPLPVTYAAIELGSVIEANPDRFMRFDAKPLLDKSREAVAKFIGAETDEVVFVSNATHGINSVLRNFEWHAGDVLLGASTTFSAVTQTMQFLADGPVHARPALHIVELNFPRTHAEVLDAFRAKLRELKQAAAGTTFTDVPPLSFGYAAASGTEKGNKIVAVIDSIASIPGVLMPWKEMVAICRDEGVWSVIDGAHSIGQEPNINLSEAKPDFWISNGYKWLYTKRAVAVLYVPKRSVLNLISPPLAMSCVSLTIGWDRNQSIMKSSLPTSLYYVSPSNARFAAVGTNFVNQHEWLGAHDPIPHITIPDALAFRNWLGGESAIHAYCNKLARDGAARLATLLGTHVMDTSGELTLNLSNVLLPLPVEPAPGAVYTPAAFAQIDALFRRRLLFDHKTYAGHWYHAGGFWARTSAQVYNEMSDFEHVAKAFIAICDEIKETILAPKAEAIP